MLKFSYLIVLLTSSFCFAQSNYSWKKSRILSEAIQEPQSIRQFIFHDSLNGFILSRDKYYQGTPLYQTQDGGETWNRTFFNDTLEINPHKVSITRDHIFLFQRSSQEATFPALISKQSSAWTNINWTFVFGRSIFTMWDNLNGYLFYDGYDPVNSQPAFAGVTHDGGYTFTDQRSSDSLIAFFKRYGYDYEYNWSDSLHCIIVPRFVRFSIPRIPTILITEDGGKTWHSNSVVSVETQLQEIGGIHGLPNSPYLWLDPPDTAATTFFRFSSDYGKTWQASSSFSGSIKQLAPVTNKEIWAIGGSANKDTTDLILHSIDNGKTWAIDNITAVGYNLESIVFTDSRHGWIAARSLDTDDQNIYIFRLQ